ncbi:MAG: helix-turn-helix domain-containing protein [Rubrobacteraceae bacterium]|nr:helix-turn-helix domain-containing protein [Rubrobacteraceae bacterium]
MSDQRRREWMTMREAAEYIGVSYERFSTLAKKGMFPVSRVPGFKNVLRVSRSRLDEVMYEHEEYGVKPEKSKAED